MTRRNDIVSQALRDAAARSQAVRNLDLPAGTADDPGA
nr:MAG TPA: hypothetical protein [Caudoviricetes sp.]